MAGGEESESFSAARGRLKQVEPGPKRRQGRALLNPKLCSTIRVRDGDGSGRLHPGADTPG